jgi:AcrR family transcriptional regulator
MRRLVGPYRSALDTLRPVSFAGTMSSVAPRTAPPSVRKRQILDAAKRRFGRIGFHATRIGEIADEAGVSVGLIYKYFEGKEALIEAIVQEDIELQFETLSAALSGGAQSLDEAIERGMEALHRLSADKDRTALMLEIGAEVIRNAKVRAFFLRAQADISSRLSERLEFLAARSGLDQEELTARAMVLSALAQGLATQLAVQPAAIGERTQGAFKRTIKSVLEGR